MRPEQWEHYKKAAKRQPIDKVPISLIIDSPWIPGHTGVKHLDFYFDPEVWFQSTLKVVKEFPEVIFFPGWWIEYGMAIEPSALGSRIRFWDYQPPSEAHMLFHLEDVDQLQPVDPMSDGFMSVTLHRYRMHKQRIFDAGYTIPFATARGPLCTASFFRGVERMIWDMVEDPAGTHKLLQYTTDALIAWLKAQVKVIGPCVEGIFILDDIIGFVGPAEYAEFAHPYMKQICDAFPKEWVKVYHNDANVDACVEHLPDAGFDVLNFGKQFDIAEIQARIKGRLTLMGNVNPLEIGVRGTPEEVKRETLRVLEATGGEGIILSMGGGVSPGMPGPNIRAMVEALNQFNGARVAV